MPYQSPTLSWHHIRDYCEKFSWIDPATHLETEGYNPPMAVRQDEIKRVPFTIKYITSVGVVETGRCVCIKVDRKGHKRMVKFIDSGEIRWVRDYLVMEVNGTRFVTRSFEN